MHCNSPTSLSPCSPASASSSTRHEPSLSSPATNDKDDAPGPLEDLLAQLLQARERRRELEAEFAERRRLFEHEKASAEQKTKDLEAQLLNELERKRSRAHEKMIEVEQELEDVDSIARLGLGIGLSRSFDLEKRENSSVDEYMRPAVRTVGEGLDQSTWRWFDRELALPSASVESPMMSTILPEIGSIADFGHRDLPHPKQVIDLSPKSPAKTASELELKIHSSLDSLIDSQIVHSPRTEASSLDESGAIPQSPLLPTKELRVIDNSGVNDPSPLVAVRKESLLTLLRAFDQILLNESR